MTALGVGGLVGQPDSAASDDEPNASAEPMEEITVVGHRLLRDLRLELQSSRERVYDLFSSLNSREEFDIHCRDAPRTGTRTVQRICRPQFVDNATAAAGKWYQIILKSNGWFTAGSGFQKAQAEMSVVPGKERELEEEVQRLTRENPEFRRAIAEYQAVEGRYEVARRGIPIAASAVIVETARAQLSDAWRRDAISPPRAVQRAMPQGVQSREGWVNLRYSVLADGRATDVLVLDAMPQGLDASGALMAVEGWTFEPATAGGMPIDWHHNGAVVVFSRDAEYAGSLDFAASYEEVADLIASGRYSDAKSRNELMQRVDATTLEEIALAQMQLAAIEHASKDPHAALDAIRRATVQGVKALADEELAIALEHRFALELELGRAADALQTYDRREALAHFESRDPLVRQGVALKQALAAPQATQAIKARVAANGLWEYAPAWGTFELANVQGTAESLGVECYRRKAELAFQPNVQVTIPPAWGECLVTLRGRPDTTFTLYEFREPAPRIERE